MDLLAPFRGLTVPGGSVKVVCAVNRFPDRSFSLRWRILQESPSSSGVLRQELSVAHKCRLWRECWIQWSAQENEVESGNARSCITAVYSSADSHAVRWSVGEGAGSNACEQQSACFWNRHRIFGVGSSGGLGWRR